MKVRKKRLEEMKKKQQSYEKRLLQLYRSLGEQALSSGEVQESLFRDDLAQYSRLNREQRELKEKVRRIGELLGKERDLKAEHKKILNSIKVDERTLDLQQVALGVSVLAAPLVPESILSQKQQYDTLVHQLEETEGHISLIEKEIDKLQKIIGIHEERRAREDRIIADAQQKSPSFLG